MVSAQAERRCLTSIPDCAVCCRKRKNTATAHRLSTRTMRKGAPETAMPASTCTSVERAIRRVVPKMVAAKVSRLWLLRACP